MEQERQRVNAALLLGIDDLLPDLPPVLAEPIRYALCGGGKRIRPILLLAAYRTAPGARRRDGLEDGVYDLATAVELIHTYSLVHDDLPCMDDDALRRGRPTLHCAFDYSTAVAAGAAMIPLAFRLLLRAAEALRLEAAERAELARELGTAAGVAGMVAGQVLDLLGEGKPLPLDGIRALHLTKTAALLEASLRLGARAARAPAALVQALGEFGRALGLAFQITDDVLDVTAPTARTGKAGRRDEALSKATFPALLGVAQARESARRETISGLRALRRARIRAPELRALARFVVERDR